jgi:hypothetical protein
MERAFSIQIKTTRSAEVDNQEQLSCLHVLHLLENIKVISYFSEATILLFDKRWLRLLEIYYDDLRNKME